MPSVRPFFSRKRISPHVLRTDTSVREGICSQPSAEYDTYRRRTDRTLARAPRTRCGTEHEGVYQHLQCRMRISDIPEPDRILTAIGAGYDGCRDRMPSTDEPDTHYVLSGSYDPRQLVAKMFQQNAGQWTTGMGDVRREDTRTSPDRQGNDVPRGARHGERPVGP